MTDFIDTTVDTRPALPTVYTDYQVSRSDTDEHKECLFVVFDVDHDIHAHDLLRDYARYCARHAPDLSGAIKDKLISYRLMLKEQEAISLLERMGYTITRVEEPIIERVR